MKKQKAKIINRKLLISLSIIGVAAAIGIGGTFAYLSDTETSSGNTFTAGILDLKIDNTCHYDGMVCQSSVWAEEEVGSSRYPELLGQACGCTWTATDLTNQLFFNFSDIKPGDDGEDTVSLRVIDNEAWACAQITNLENQENNCNEPESIVDSTCGNPGQGQGEHVFGQGAGGIGAPRC